jgi:hypothetical protein
MLRVFSTAWTLGFIIVPRPILPDVPEGSILPTIPYCSKVLVLPTIPYCFKVLIEIALVERPPKAGESFCG